MNAFVKKEIRLLLPSWIIAMVLALPPLCTRADDGLPVFLLFMGLMMLALTSFGRETSLNTFSSMLAQPVARTRLWKTKLCVLAVAFLAVFAVWRLAILFSFKDYGGSAADPEDSAAVIIAGSLVVVATFTGGLWTTLLLRQIAGAFWLAMLTPAVVTGLTVAFLVANNCDDTDIVVLCVVLGIYSLGGLLLARWLFFRAQDIGWSGGVIVLPEWKFFGTRSENDTSARNRRPIRALIKKEFGLQQISLLGAAGLLALHLSVIGVRHYHPFAKNSTGEMLSVIVWMLWLVLPVLIGAMAVAEERRLGVMESQLCLPVSRRVQFIIKIGLAMLLGIVLGGVLPMALELLDVVLTNPIHGVQREDVQSSSFFIFGVIGLSAWLTLVSFFASSLARNFLQAAGYAIALFIAFTLLIPLFTNNRMVFFDSVARQSILPLVLAVPTTIVTLLVLAYLNFKNFRPGWPLWRRHLLGFAAAAVFLLAASAGLYHRVWEILEPAEPAHGPARLSLASPPFIRAQPWQDDLQVQLPDGRVWYDQIKFQRWQQHPVFNELLAALTPFPASVGPGRFLNGSNWVSAVVRHLNTSVQGTNGTTDYIRVIGFLETVGVQADGTLWVSGKSDSPAWTEDRLTQFGTETNWLAVSWSHPVSSVLLLKKDGTLWRWGPNRVDWHQPVFQWPALRAFQPYQIGTNADWKELSPNNPYAQKADGSTWQISADVKKGMEDVIRATNYDQVDLRKVSPTWDSSIGARVRKDGTLWYWHWRGSSDKEIIAQRCGHETNWYAGAFGVGMNNDDTTLKTDGTLWRGMIYPGTITRVGIHQDWVAIAAIGNGTVTLAADGSLWFWPNPNEYQYGSSVLQLPKQPKLLANVFNQAE